MKTFRNKDVVRKIITACQLFLFIVIGLIDALLHGQMTYSSIMGMDIHRVYFYTFFLLIIGCWLLYNKFLTGTGFITLATFSSYFFEYVSLHNYFASILIYIGLMVDLITRKKYKWLIPFICIGIIQGLAFVIPGLPGYLVGAMEFTALCFGSVFIVKNI